MVTRIITTFLWAVPLTIFSQNLVRNPSFENFDNCPAKFDNVEQDLPYWSRPTGGTTDYFNKCSNVNLGVPKNFNGTQESQNGNGYAGFYLNAPNDYREYIQGELSEPLIRGKKYKISFHVSLADRSQQAVRDIGILFTKKSIREDIKTPLTRQNDSHVNNEYNFVEFRDWTFFDDKENWTLLEKTFVAEGPERYFTIGNFLDNDRTQFKKLEGSKGAAYYYLDNVKVEEDIDEKAQDFVLNQTYRLDNVLFPHDVHQLNQTAKDEIEQLYDQLKEDVKLTVTIQAHTDNVGNSRYNKKLSSKRAHAVADYLISLGLPTTRVNWAGFGGEQPIADNKTTLGKRTNRRAEFIVSSGRSEGEGDIVAISHKDYKD